MQSKNNLIHVFKNIDGNDDDDLIIKLILLN